MYGNLLKVRNIFKDNEDSNIQKILRLEWISNELRNTVLRVAIDSYNIQDQEKAIEIIELIWQKADQKTRDFLCNTEYDLAGGDSVNTINMLRGLQERTNDSNNGPVLGKVIQEMEEHKRVRDFNYELHVAITSFNVDQVEATLENCGEDVERVLEREVYWSSGRVDALLVYPLKVKYKELNQEDVKKIKEITKLLWDKASPDVRNFWLEDYMVNREG
ncbi:hypothetical protein [Wolbachia endosymbiont (group A) of Ennomos erosarius]|uniref:hypothetical protein n=1 Tax=Wolbachia endosymbiont (group A) of Ennomos erosarius TaxID=3066174 RepID=UPI003341E7F6